MTRLNPREGKQQKAGNTRPAQGEKCPIKETAEGGRVMKRGHWWRRRHRGKWAGTGELKEKTR